jgi:hypothetical protein
MVAVRMATSLLKKLQFKFRQVSCLLIPLLICAGSIQKAVASHLTSPIELKKSWSHFTQPTGAISRGIPTAELTADHCFFTGPVFLLDPQTM